MSGLSYEKESEIPEGMRKLIEEQKSKQEIHSGYDLSKLENPGTYIVNPNDSTTPKNIKHRKYRNTPTDRLLPNGECLHFQSKKEALRYDYLMVEQKAGRIRNLRLQVQYLIQESYTDAVTGERNRGASYFADFVYERLEDGEWIQHVEDTKGGGRKGTATKTYQLKRKLVEAKGIHVEEV